MRKSKLLAALGISLIASGALIGATPPEDLGADVLQASVGGNQQVGKCPWTCNEAQTDPPPPIPGSPTPTYSCIGKANDYPCLNCERHAEEEVYRAQQMNTHCVAPNYQSGQTGAYDCGNVLAGLCKDEACDATTDAETPCDDPRPPVAQPPS